MSRELETITVELFRSAGRLLNCGVNAKVPAVPRSSRLRYAVGQAAERDRNVMRAWEHALANAAKVERTRQLAPQTIHRRNCGDILEIR
jgi:hypothetical protein